MWPDEFAKSTEATAVVCAALLCAFSRCSLAFFALIFLSFLVPLGWCQCFGRYHTKQPSSTTKRWQLQSSKNMMAGVTSLMTSSRLHPLGHLSHTLPRHLGMHARACKNTELVLPNLHWRSKQNVWKQPLVMATRASSTMASSPWQPFSHTSILAAMLKHCKTCAHAMPHVLIAWAWARASDTASYQSGIQNCSWKLCQYCASWNLQQTYPLDMGAVFWRGFDKELVIYMFLYVFCYAT